jgi:hypothetical protein
MSPMKAAPVEPADRDDAILRDLVRALARQAARHYLRATKTAEPALREIASTTLDDALLPAGPDATSTGVKNNDDK